MEHETELGILEATFTVASKPSKEAEVDLEDDDHDTLVDIHDALVLLTTAQHLLNYISNPTLCSAVSKRERASMERVSNQISGFLSEVSPIYMEEG